MTYIQRKPQHSELCEFIRHGFNILLEGKHGTGKTHMLMDAFAEALGEDGKPALLNEHFLYFSASTLDPWVDLVGVPRTKTIQYDSKDYDVLDIVPPEIMVKPIRGIIFDELNRAPKKVRNAVMELIQFKSINKRPFPHLKCIAAAINPEDDEELTFDVEALDPAQKDRFQVQIETPYQIDKDYFALKYGKDSAEAISVWWNQLNDDMKKSVTPRQAEEILKAHNLRLNIDFLVPPQANTTKLRSLLNNGSPEKVWRKFIENDDKEKASIWLQKASNLESVEEIIGKETKSMRFAIPLLDMENVMRLIDKYEQIYNDMFKENPEHYADTISAIADCKLDDLEKDSSDTKQNKLITKSAYILDHIDQKSRTEDEMKNQLKDAVKKRKQETKTTKGRISLEDIEV